jgi:hypothetical protein
MLIAPTASARKRFDAGVRDHINLIVTVRQRAYATAELFHRYITEVFFPALETNRQPPGCENKLCVLFCDNCSIHCQDQLVKEFDERGVTIITCPPHTWHLFQVLDRLLFGRLKATKKYIPGADADPTYTDHLVRIFKAYELVTTSTTVRASWKKAGFEYCKLDDTFQLSLTMGRFGIRRDLAHNFSSGGAIGSAESTKMGIHEQAVFQGKIPEDSQITRTRLNNNSLTSHEVCWIINIAMFLSSERYLIA